MKSWNHHWVKIGWCTFFFWRRGHACRASSSGAFIYRNLWMPPLPSQQDLPTKRPWGLGQQMAKLYGTKSCGWYILLDYIQKRTVHKELLKINNWIIWKFQRFTLHKESLKINNWIIWRFQCFTWVTIFRQFGTEKKIIIGIVVKQWLHCNVLCSIIYSMKSN